MKIERFEDIQGWQEARTLTKKTYQLTNKSPFKRDRELCNQTQKASVSIMANIAEGFDRNPRKSSSNFYIMPQDLLQKFKAICMSHWIRNIFRKIIFRKLIVRRGKQKV